MNQALLGCESGELLGDAPLFGDDYESMVDEWAAPAAIVLLQSSELVPRYSRDTAEM